MENDFDKIHKFASLRIMKTGDIARLYDGPIYLITNQMRPIVPWKWIDNDFGEILELIRRAKEI